MRVLLLGIVLSTSLCVMTLCASAQDSAPADSTTVLRPDAATRVVGSFDFEEAAATTQPVPPHWLRVLHNPPARLLPHFPPWNASQYDDAFATSGRFSIKLPVSGGSTRLRLSGGVLPALPDADYAISASIRTQGLVHSRARLIARFLDESLTPIPDAFIASEPLRAERQWEHVVLELPGREMHAAWIQIDLEVLQPNELPNTIDDDTRIEMEDFHGAAWFDDVEVRQLPRIQLRTNAPGNVILAPDTPILTATVRDLTGESLHAKITIFDIDNIVVAEYSFLGVSRGEGVDWKPSLPRLGWYRAELAILSNQRDVATTHLPFVWMPGPGRDTVAPPSRFGITVESLKAGQFPALSPLINALGAGSVHLPVWDVDASLIDHETYIEDLDLSIHTLLNAGKTITLTMPDIPSELATLTRIDPQLPLLLTDAPTLRWTKYLDPVLTRFGQRITRWQPGRTDLDRYHEVPSLTSNIKTFHEFLARLSPEPVVVLPWQAADAYPASFPHAMRSTFVPSWLPPESIEHLLNHSLDTNTPLDSIVIEHAPAHLATPRSRVADVIKRAVMTTKFDVQSVLMQQPWRWNKSQPLLDPEFAAWRTVINQLSDRQTVGSLPMPDGANVAILAGPGGGVLVAWNDWANPQDAVITGYLGTGTLIITDAFGNQQQVHPDSAGEHHIPLTSMPIFITGIDTNICLFRNLFRIEPPFILSLAARHDLTITLENPWPIVISGTIRIHSPESWDITPRSQTFSVEPHGTRALPIAATIGVGDEAGIHDVVAQIELQADTKHPIFLLATQVEIGLKHVQLTATARRAPNPKGGPDDVIVTLLVRNTSDKPVTMNAFTIATSFARQQAPVSNIPPGASAVRQFTYHNAADTIGDSRIRVGIEEIDGPLRLNKSVTLD